MLDSHLKININVIIAVFVDLFVSFSILLETPI